MEWVFNVMNLQKHSVLHLGGKGGNWQIRETPAFLTSGMVQGIVCVSLEIPSCKRGGRPHCALGLLMVTQLDPGSSRHTCCGDVQLFPSLMHTEADAAADSKGVPAAGEEAWLPCLPKGSFPVPLPWVNSEEQRSLLSEVCLD